MKKLSQYSRKQRVLGGVGIGAVVLVGIAIGTGGSSTPPNAADVLKSDGYSVALNESPAQISTDFGSASPDISSAAAGLKGSTLEVVVVANGSSIAASDLQTAEAYIQTGTTGLSSSVQGNVLRVSGPEASFTNSVSSLGSGG